MITKRKMDPYPEALVQERSAIFLQGASLLSVGATSLVVEDSFIGVHYGKQPSVSSDSGEGGTLAVLRKVSCQPLFAA